LDVSHKLDPWPLDEGPQSKSDKLRLNLIGTIFGGQINCVEPQKKLLKKRRAHDLKNQDAH